ncbi:glycosyltransferase [Cellulomonas rhizosphaerae]|uniref:Glycosyltransferase family 2 protein n=1 Tax=Cellulomonas rhizosphaerae TaxID=2293719 RepID=A0A413RK85_9CELL|nr:glycosyltransferase [Cellulomonas rhizosphaerae]RHA39391.1 glycosyltransferase family 2 protein [Cellulomonas rhizosphaerae]
MTETLLPVGPPATTSSTPATAPVTAVVVTRGLTTYLPRTLAALAAQTRRPLRIVLVDAGESPDQRLAALLEQTVAAAGGAPQPALTTIAAPGARTFGDAVRRALADGAEGPGLPATWLWFLHDDSAPAPGALAELARAVTRARSVGVAGAKQRTWSDPERLLEAGLRTSRSGRRMTDVEPGELDQGQHDARDDVLGVGLAGALVRRDVWDALRGTDPVLGPFGDGLDLSRRARLAGHRVIVVPEAVVRHAQAGFLGLRDEHDEPDARRSHAARRRALVHQRLASAPLLLVPVIAVLALGLGVVRSLAQLAAKQPGLAVDELRAPLEALARPVAVVRARTTARRTRTVSRRTLRPLQATWQDVWRQTQDRRLARAEARRVVQAPSELELRELAQLTTRRRVTLGALAAVLVLVVAVALGPLIGAAAGGARLVGAALAPAASDLGQLWSAATSGWVAGGLGAPGPADALLDVLAAPTFVAGGELTGAVSVLLLGSVLLAGLGAWAAAGAATRSVGVRAWAAIVWAGAPSLLLGLGEGRLGPVLAHAALPWVVLGVARAVGVQRVDQVLSGIATASHEGEDAADEADIDTPVRGNPTIPTQRVGGELVGTPDPTGSLTAAAAAALAFAVVAAGAPVLLVPGALALLVLALCVPRSRARLLLVLVPALVLLGPTLVEASRRGVPGWRLLVAGPGLPVAGTPTTPVERLLGLPADASALVPSWAQPVADVWPLLAGGAVVLLALLALLRGAPAARAVRVGWVVAAIGLAAATLVARIPVGVQDGVTAYGWTGPLLSLAGLGLLTAAVLGADRLQVRLAHQSFGWRQPLVALVTVVAVAAPVAWLGGWTWQARTGEAVALRAIDDDIVPAVGRQSQTSPDASRVLALAAAPAGSERGPDVTWQLLRGDGPLLVDQAAAVSTRVLVGGLTDATVRGPDDAAAEVEDLVARLVGGASGDVAGPLGALAVSDVLVPRIASDTGDASAARTARERLVATLDSTAGLERVTQSAQGTLWRVQPLTEDADAAVTAWARIAPQGADLTDAATAAVAVASNQRTIDTTIPAGSGERLLVLAERADAHWQARLDGRSLRAVDDGWRQVFQVGAAGGHLTLHYDAPQRTPWLVAQGLVLLVTVLLAVPVRRRRGVRA